MVTPGAGTAARGIDEVLAGARRRLRRLSPQEAQAAMRDGALLVDTRRQALRAAEGWVPGSLHVDRNELEWRLDPCCEARLPHASDHGVRVIVMCSDGYASSLAAVSLQDLGLVHATDLAGGFRAWKRAGLPVTGGPGAG
jgi:rhodanese-related sulfurtransferase